MKHMEDKGGRLRRVLLPDFSCDGNQRQYCYRYYGGIAFGFAVAG